MPTITIDVAADGAVRLTVDGVSGASCKHITAALERELGTVTGSQPTADMHRSATSDQRRNASH